LRIAVLNGPNLNLLGTREPEVYGSTTLAEIEARLAEVAGELGVRVAFAQFNHEGDLIDAVHALGGRPAAPGVAPELREKADGALVNAGGWTHTSIALRDALTGVSLPFIEVHLSNIYAREPERRHSVLASAALGLVCGLGAQGYELALRGLVAQLKTTGKKKR
jgi:3-dehydroquinate dehydratase-2